MKFLSATRWLDNTARMLETPEITMSTSRSAIIGSEKAAAAKVNKVG